MRYNRYFSTIALLVLVGLVLTRCKNGGNKNIQKIDEVVIIGGGLMGSAAAWQLAKDGQKVWLLEKQDSIYTSGSSQGEARIARSSNRGNDIWSYMHNTSVKEVATLIEFLNESYPDRSFKMSDVYSTNPVSYVGRTSIYDKLLTSLVRQKVNYKMAATPEEGKRLFDVSLPEDVLLQREYNQHSGTINPKTLIQYLHKAVEAMGGKIAYGHQVDSISRIEDGYRLYVSNQDEVATLDAMDVISAAGPYTGELLKDIAPYFEELINPKRVFLAFYKIRKEIFEKLSAGDKEKLLLAYPVINSSKGTREGSFFSMIEYFEEGVPVIKIGGHFQRSDIDDMDKVWQRDVEQFEKDWAHSSTVGYFELLDLPIAAEDLIYDHGYSCVYSLTENEVPLVTPIMGEYGGPDHHFIVLGGMSGVGAKGAMTYGKIAAESMLGIEQTDTMYRQVKDILGFDRITHHLQ